MSPRRAHLVLALALLPLLAGCGRKGPLELPPDVQAARDARVQQQEADAAIKAKASGQKPKLSEEGARPKSEPVPGEMGHRPPADYPFLLDPLL